MPARGTRHPRRALALGALVKPSSAASGTVPRIGIVGAGISGLAAVRSLAARFDVQLEDVNAAEPPGSMPSNWFHGQYYTTAQLIEDLKPVLPILQQQMTAAGYPTVYNRYNAAGYALDVSMNGLKDTRREVTRSDLGEFMGTSGSASPRAARRCPRGTSWPGGGSSPSSRTEMARSR
jgi:hypothetical protein